VYRPRPPLLWRVPDALAHIRRLFGVRPEGVALEHFLPPPQTGHISALQRRAALASTLIAGLELSRGGAAVIQQDEVFGEIRLRPTGSRVVARCNPSSQCTTRKTFIPTAMQTCWSAVFASPM
jgi:segregation and condensation protein A